MSSPASTLPFFSSPLRPPAVGAAPAVFQIGVDRLVLMLVERLLRRGDDQERGVVGDLGLRREQDVLHLVVLVLERALGGGVAVRALLVVEPGLAVAGQE